MVLYSYYSPFALASIAWTVMELASVLSVSIATCCDSYICCTCCESSSSSDCWVTSVNQWKVHRTTLESQSGVTTVLIVLRLCVREDDWTLEFTNDIPLLLLNMLVKSDKLTTAVLLNEVLKVCTSSAHYHYKLIFACRGDVALLCGTSEGWNVVCLEVVWYLIRFQRNRRNLTISVRLWKLLGAVDLIERNEINDVRDSTTVSVSIRHIVYVT